MGSTIYTNLTNIKTVTTSSLNALAQNVDYDFKQLTTGLTSFLNTIGYDATNNLLTISGLTTSGNNNFTGNTYYGPSSAPTLTITPDGKLVGQTINAPIIQVTRLRYNNYNTVSNIGIPGIAGEVVYVGPGTSYTEGIYAYLTSTGWTALTGSGGGGGATMLSQLSDVSLSNVQNGQVLTFSTTGNKWVNSAFSLTTLFTGLGNLTSGIIPYWNGTTFANSIASYNSGTNTVNVNGNFTATTKSFLIDHPRKPGYKLQYGNLEGPEHAIYVRGRATGDTIYLPSHWNGLADLSTLSVALTPIGKHRKLYFKDNVGLVVKVGGAGKHGSYFYHIFAERIDVPKLVTEIKLDS